jgi:hypothetical protein
MQSRPHSSVSAGQTQRPLDGSHAPEQHSSSAAQLCRNDAHACAIPTVSGARTAAIPAAAPPRRVFSAPRRDVTNVRAKSSNRDPSTGCSDLTSRILNCGGREDAAGGPTNGLEHCGGSGSGHPPRTAFAASIVRQGCVRIGRTAYRRPSTRARQPNRRSPPPRRLPRLNHWRLTTLQR